MNDKTDRLLEAIEHPERFSDEELNALLSEPEIRELYDLMSKTSDAVAETPVYDLDKEWDTFVTNHYRSKNFILKFFNRHAAAVMVRHKSIPLLVKIRDRGFGYCIGGLGHQIIQLT